MGGAKRMYTVIDEVYRLTVGTLISVLKHHRVPETPSLFAHPELTGRPAVPQLAHVTEEEGHAHEVILMGPAHEEATTDEGPTAFRTIEDILKDAQTVSVPAHATNNTVMYVRVGRAALLREPDHGFDTVVGTLSYGDMVMALEHRGKYAKVAFGTLTGWILRSNLADRAAGVYPEFTIGVPHDVDNEQTIRVRAMIQDEFGGTAAELPLQAGEYVVYRLLRKGVVIPWTVERPRTPGTWHQLLRGAPGVHVGIAPKTGSIMEYVGEHGVGHLAFVEAVYPDETISISEANYPDRGIYNERLLTKEEWREVRPVFIQVLSTQ